MKMSKRSISITINIIIFVSVVITASLGIFFGAGDGQNGTAVIGLGYFKPFTMDSNILAGISSLIFILYSIKSEDTLPKWVMNLHLMSSASLGLTFIIAAFFLAPMNVLSGESYFIMFSNDMFFFHLVNPLLSFISFAVVQKDILYKRQECIIGAFPTIIYSFVYIFMVVIVKRWEDFYNFTLGGHYSIIPLVLIIIYSIVIIVSFLLLKLHNRTVRNSDI